MKNRGVIVCAPIFIRFFYPDNINKILPKENAETEKRMEKLNTAISKSSIVSFGVPPIADDLLDLIMEEPAANVAAPVIVPVPIGMQIDDDPDDPDSDEEKGKKKRKVRGGKTKTLAAKRAEAIVKKTTELRVAGKTDEFISGIIINHINNNGFNLTAVTEITAAIDVIFGKEKDKKAKLHQQLANVVAAFEEGSVQKNTAMDFCAHTVDRVQELKERRVQAAAAMERLKKDVKLCEEMIGVMDLKLSLLVSDKDSAFFARGVLHNEQGKKYEAEHNEYAI